MTTLSVPLSADLEKFIDEMVLENKAENKAAVVRIALRKMKKDEATHDVLRAQRELIEGKVLDGNPKDLIKCV